LSPGVLVPPPGVSVPIVPGSVNMDDQRDLTLLEMSVRELSQQKVRLVTELTTTRTELARYKREHSEVLQMQALEARRVVDQSRAEASGLREQVRQLEENMRNVRKRNFTLEEELGRTKRNLGDRTAEYRAAEAAMAQNRASNLSPSPQLGSPSSPTNGQKFQQNHNFYPAALVSSDDQQQLPAYNSWALAEQNAELQTKLRRLMKIVEAHVTSRGDNSVEGRPAWNDDWWKPASSVLRPPPRAANRNRSVPSQRVAPGGASGFYNTNRGVGPVEFLY